MTKGKIERVTITSNSGIEIACFEVKGSLSGDGCKVIDVHNSNAFIETIYFRDEP